MGHCDLIHLPVAPHVANPASEAQLASIPKVYKALLFPCHTFSVRLRCSVVVRTNDTPGITAQVRALSWR